MIRQVQAEVAPITVGPPGAAKPEAAAGKGAPLPPVRPNENLVLLRRDNAKLRRQVEKLEATLERKNERVRVLEDLAAELQREVAQLRGGASPKAASGETSAQ